MSLSRRAFLGTTSALALAYGLPKDSLGSALAAPAKPNVDAPTTLLQTVTQKQTPVRGKYRTLLAGPGEPHLARYDVLGFKPRGNRYQRRRSIGYLGHMSDIHIMDAQSPARIEPLTQPFPSTFAGAIRPQDTLTVFVQGQILATMQAARYSPLTGAPMAALLNTGDNADMHSDLELQWYIDILDGQSVTPNSGEAGVYDGPQAWLDIEYAWHPADPGDNPFGEYGFPQIPDLLNTAVSTAMDSPGSPVPWYTVFGNHDTLYFGAFPIDAALRALALGGKKPAEANALAGDYLNGMAQNPTALTRLEAWIRTQFGAQSGMMSVPSDPARRLMDSTYFIQAHLNSPDMPGPVGHGFTQENLDTGRTYWKADAGPRIRLFGLDTCNQVMGADGAVPRDQFDWLESELAQVVKEDKLALILSHHNSYTLENAAEPVMGESQDLVHAEEFVDMLLKYPNMIAWVNGHTHINTITAHPPKEKKQGGFWEITTASCIDYPQTQQTIEIVDNQDQTISIFATVIDALAPATWDGKDLSPTGLASLSRELASNDWIENPLMRIGSAYDRNVELLLPAPFKMSKISPAELERTDASRKARLIAGRKASRS